MNVIALDTISNQVTFILNKDKRTWRRNSHTHSHTMLVWF